MTFKPGDVVMLKSGGHALTVAEVKDQTIECVWIGEEGDLFREDLPLAVLESVYAESSDEDDLDHDEDDDEDEEDDQSHKSRKKKAEIA